MSQTTEKHALLGDDPAATDFTLRARLAVAEEEQDLARARAAIEAELAIVRAQAAAELAQVRAESAAELASLRAELANVQAEAAVSAAAAATAAQAELAEVADELTRLRDEFGRVQADADIERARSQSELASLEQLLGHATKTLLDLRGSRGYRLMRRLGRWSSLEKHIRRVVR